MASHQIELKSMLMRLKQWNQQLGGGLGRNIEGNEFDYLQQQFLVKRHQVQKAQDTRQKQGITTANASLGYQIREGLKAMGDLVEKMRAEQHRLAKKKKDPVDVQERKLKIVENCQLLLKDLEERQEEGMPTNKAKIQTLTDMKLKLLHEIDENNVIIHEKRDSDGRLTQSLEEDKQQIRKWKQKDQEMDGAIDDIIVGVRGLKGKVKQMNQAQDIINDKTKKGLDKADKLGNRIQGDNEKLKKIIEQFKPNRCCLYIALFLLLVGLVVTILKVLV